MAGGFLKWLVAGAIAVGGGTALAVVLVDPTMTADLGSRAAAALREPEFAWASAAVDGRDAILSGTATNQQMIDAASQRLLSVRGVRTVESAVTLAEFVSPFPFSASLEDGKLLLAGGFPDDGSHAAILADAPGALDQLRLMSGGPPGADFSAGATYALGVLSQMDQGRADLEDLSLRIEGRAKSPAAFDILATLAQSAPAAVKLESLKVTPALASPFKWEAHFDGKTATVTGFAGDSAFADQLRAIAPAGISVSTNLALASGEPGTFSANALILLKSLLQLQSGDATIIDSAMELSGAPASAEIAAAVTAEVQKIGAKVRLDPPEVGNFTFSATKTGDSIGFLGFVPDAGTRTRLGAISGANVTKLELARGAPERFASALDFGLAALERLSEGEFAVNGTRLTLTGRAATPADLTALQSMIAEGPPQGTSLGAADIQPPLADPFLFSATKSAGGLALQGFIPDEATRTALRALAGEFAADDAALAGGAPEGFLASARNGLNVLMLLDAGTVAYDGSHWSIEGSVDSVQKSFAAAAAYSIAGLRTAGWTYEVTEPKVAAPPALPIIAPYAWGAQKDGNGRVTVTGFSPSQEFKDYLGASSGEGTLDSSILGAGAPENFIGNAKAGIDALRRLDEGALSLSGENWTLTGRIGSATARAEVQDVLSGKIDPADWRIAIQAPDAAPIVTPYLWVAEKLETGAVDLSGYLPSDSLKSFVEVRAGEIGRNSVAIASGEPSGFSDDVLAGLDALAHAVTGKASFDGSQWTFSGLVETDTDAAAATASLLAGSQSGAHWQKSITVLAPSEEQVAEASSSSEAPNSSEEPVPPTASSEEVSSSEAPSSSVEPPSSAEEPASSDLASNEVPAAAAPTEATLSSEEPPSATSVKPAIPERLLFQVSRSKGTGVALAGAVPAEAARAYFGSIAGAAPTDAVTIDPSLPQTFITDAIAAIDIMSKLGEGRAGFDGGKWWIEGKVADEATRDSVLATIAALPTSLEWSSDITLYPAIDLCRETVTELAARNAIVFKSGSATLADESGAALDELAGDLRICPDAIVHVEGHTDADGAEDINLALSVWRAEAVVGALIDRGINADRLYAEGYGETMPIASNETKAGKQANRRIAFTVSEGD
ncbi:MAG: OmpA family protein [Devosia sp.]